MTTPFPFVSGAVLTAAQLNAIGEVPVSAKTANYVLVASDANSRITMSNASATTITVNTGLFSAGQSLRIQNIGAGACTITAGTATVTSAGPLALVQWAGGQLYFTSASAAVWFPDAITASASGLTYITGASFSAAATVSMAAGTFTATYKNYLVYLNLTTTAAGTVNIRVNVAGTPATGTSYYSGYTARGSGGASNAGSNTTSMTLGPSVFGAYNLNSVINCFDPQTSTGQYDNNITATTVTFWDTINPGVSVMGGGTDSIGAYDGLTFTSSTTMTGLYKVYGLANS